MIAFVKKSTRFYVTQSDYDGLVSNPNAGLVIECTPKEGNHPKGTYTLPNKIAREFVESKMDLPCWKNDGRYHQGFVPLELEEYFKS